MLSQDIPSCLKTIAGFGGIHTGKIESSHSTMLSIFLSEGKLFSRGSEVFINYITFAVMALILSLNFN